MDETPDTTLGPGPSGPTWLERARELSRTSEPPTEEGAPPRGWQAVDWVEYQRRLRTREAERQRVVALLGWTSCPGWGRVRRSQFQVNHPEFGGRVAAAVSHHAS